MPNPTPQYYLVLKDNVYKQIHPIDLSAYLEDGWKQVDEETIGVAYVTSNKPVADDEPLLVAFSAAMSPEALKVENATIVTKEEAEQIKEGSELPPDATVLRPGEATTPPAEPTPDITKVEIVPAAEPVKVEAVPAPPPTTTTKTATAAPTTAEPKSTTTVTAAPTAK
jgi:hypothetical protein